MCGDSGRSPCGRYLGILARVRLQAGALEDEDGVAELQYDQCDYRQHCTKKEIQSAKFLVDMPRSARVLSVAAIVTEGTDFLSARLQSCDANGNSLTEMTSKENNPLVWGRAMEVRRLRYLNRRTCYFQKVGP